MTEKSHQPSRRQTDAAQHGGGRRFLLDFGPLLLFFVANYLFKDLDLECETASRCDPNIPSVFGWYSFNAGCHDGGVRLCGLVFFAGLTIYFDDEIFIKIKPTVLTLMFAAVIAGGRLIGRNPLAALVGQQIRLTDAGWRAVSWLWVTMFVCSAAATRSHGVLSTDDGVTFKVFA